MTFALALVVIGVIVTALAIYTHEALTRINFQRKR
jgi:hypothetical protein